MVLTTYPFTTSTNYDFSSAEIVVTGGIAKKLANVFPNELAYSDFAIDGNLTRGVGTLTGTLAGGAVITNEELDFTPSGVTTYTMPADNFSLLTQEGAIRFEYTPNYTGAPASSIDIFTTADSAPFINNLIDCIHVSSGAFNITFFSSTGVSLFTLGSTVWTPTAGVKYDIEINFDLTGGASRLFIDGVQLGSTITTTGTRNAQVLPMFFGRSLFGTLSDYFIDDIQVYSTVQHTANFTPKTTFTTYSANGDFISPNTTNKIDTVALISMSETVVKPTNTDIKYALTIDGVDKYHNGSTWVNSSGSSQVNTVSEINTNASTLDLSTQVVLIVKIYLFSTFGRDTPSIDNLTVSHDFAPPIITVNKCIVRVDLIDASGNPIVGAKIKFIPNDFFYEEIYIFKDVEVVTDSQGKASVSIVETASKSATMDIRIEYQNGTVELFRNKIIPDQSNEALSNIILT